MKTEKRLHLVVVTPYAKFYEGEVDFVVLPTSEGESGILVNHVPVVFAIYPGSLRLRIGEDWRYAFVSNGYAQVGDDYVVVICNAAEWAESIDVNRAQSNINKNQARLDRLNPVADRVQCARSKHAIRRNKMRIHVAEQYGQSSQSN